MQFISFEFIIFIAVVFLAYFLVPKKGQWIVLLAASYVFYALAGGGKTFGYILFTTISVFLGGLWLENINGKQKASLEGRDKEWLKQNKKKQIAGFTKKKQGVVALVLILNFGLLGFVKYYDFLAEGFNMAVSLTSDGPLPIFSILLPLGISFYTFQSVGYLIDVYRGKIAADRNIAKFALFVSFFPQVVQGPISRYDQLAGQLYAPHKLEYTRFKYGFQLAVWGAFKALLIGETANMLTSSILPNYLHHSGAEIAIGVAAFCIQIYANFSGGIDIARGVAQCLGIDMEENFHRPFFATSVGDYWRRWHITLGAWMKDYILYPLTLSKGFSRMGKALRKNVGPKFAKYFPTCLAMFIVFMVVGIWHGPGMKFIMFGLYNGAFIIMGVLAGPGQQKFAVKHPKLTIEKNVLMRILAILLTNVIIFFSKYFASADTFEQAIGMLQRTFTDYGGFDSFSALVNFLGSCGFRIRHALLLLYSCGALFVVGMLQEKGIAVREALSRRNIVLRWFIYLVILLSVLLYVNGFSVDGGEFIYAQF